MNSSRSLLVRLALAAALASALAACETAQEPDVAAAPISGIVKERQITTVATVQKLDLGKRLVTLKGQDGKVFSIHAGDQVKNLPQVKVGDQVSTTYYESIAYEVHKPGTGTARSAWWAPPGSARRSPGRSRRASPPT